MPEEKRLPATDELLKVAMQDDGAATIARIETCVHALFGDVEQAEESQRSHASMVDASSSRRDQIAGLVDSVSTIVEARLSGVHPSKIVSPKDLRVAITTEMVGRGVLVGIVRTRQEVDTIMEDLKSQSEEGIDAGPLANTMERISQACLKMNEGLRRLEQIAMEATKGVEGDGLDEGSAEATHLIQRAQKVFEPFIQGNHDITMDQLRRLKAFLLEAGSINNDFGTLLEDGLRRIREAERLGNHQEASEIEESLYFNDMIDNFGRLSRALNNSLNNHGVVTAHAMGENRAILSTVPPEDLEAADKAGDSSVRELFRESYDDLVISSKDGLELK